MAYTQHGWEIPNTPNLGPSPSWNVFCGGPDECADCRIDVEMYQLRKYIPKDKPAEIFAMLPLMQAVITAWNNCGEEPSSFHEARKTHLLVDWPILGRAVEALATLNN